MQTGLGAMDRPEAGAAATATCTPCRFCSRSEFGRDNCVRASRRRQRDDAPVQRWAHMPATFTHCPCGTAPDHGVSFCCIDGLNSTVPQCVSVTASSGTEHGCTGDLEQQLAA